MKTTIDAITMAKIERVAAQAGMKVCDYLAMVIAKKLNKIPG